MRRTLPDVLSACCTSRRPPNLRRASAASCDAVGDGEVTRCIRWTFGGQADKRTPGISEMGGKRTLQNGASTPVT